MLTKDHKIYKAFKEMMEAEKEIRRKKEKLFWKGLDGPFWQEETEIHRKFWKLVEKTAKEEDLNFKLSELYELYNDDKNK